MATLSPTALASPRKTSVRPRDLVDQYFYFAMSLLFPVIVIWGFSRTVNDSLFHAAIPRPAILWFHGGVFFGWIIFFLFQSVLVRTRNVKWHRTFGWFGAALGATIVPLGIATAIVMGRFDKYQLHQAGSEAFLIIPFYDIAAFGTLFTLAVVWRKKSEMHRRLIFVASCILLEAAFARFDFIFDHSLFPFCPDLLIALGIVRDLVVNRRIHRVYLVALPVLIVVQSMVTLIWRGEVGWWVHIAHGILG